jgi:hypothetical protein
LAQQGFSSTGVDYSRVALSKAQTRADRAGVRCHFVNGDLTAPEIRGVTGPFDLVLDLGTVDDLAPTGRAAMAATIRRLTTTGSLVLFWCFYADPADLPRFSFTGPSRAVPVIRSGEERELFGADFTIDPYSRDDRTACFLLTRT